MRCCQDQPSEELLRAVEEFNRGDWFECHETLEELWVGSKGEARDFYQGVLQFAVALHHWRNGNLKGALVLLKGAGNCLGRVASICQGVDVARLTASAGELSEALSLLGEERMRELPATLIPEIGVVGDEDHLPH